MEKYFQTQAAPIEYLAGITANVIVQVLLKGEHCGERRWGITAIEAESKKLR